MATVPQWFAIKLKTYHALLDSRQNTQNININEKQGYLCNLIWVTRFQTLRVAIVTQYFAASNVTRYAQILGRCERSISWFYKQGCNEHPLRSLSPRQHSLTQEDSQSGSSWLAFSLTMTCTSSLPSPTLGKQTRGNSSQSCGLPTLDASRKANKARPHQSHSVTTGERTYPGVCNEHFSSPGGCRNRRSQTSYPSSFSPVQKNRKIEPNRQNTWKRGSQANEW